MLTQKVPFLQMQDCSVLSGDGDLQIFAIPIGVELHAGNQTAEMTENHALGC